MARPSLVCVASLLLYLAAPASAYAAFTFAGAISGSDARAVYGHGPHVAVAPNGDAVFGWTRFDGTSDSCCYRVHARARSAAGALSPVQTLTASGHNAVLGDIGIDGDGDAVFVWYTPNVGSFSPGGPARARVRSAAGALSPIQILSQDPPTYGPVVAVSPNGRAIFAWTAGGRVRTRARSASGTLSAVQTLSGFRGIDPQVAVDTSGNAVFAWRLEGQGAGCDNPLCGRIQTRARSTGGALSAVQDLSEKPLQGGAFGPRVGVDSDGDAVFAWTRHRAGGRFIETRARTKAGTLSTLQDVSQAHAGTADVGVDSDGDAVFAWEQLCSGYYCALTRARSVAGVLSPLQGLSEPNTFPFRPHVAVDADGDAAFTWKNADSTTQCGGRACHRIHARSRSRAGALSPLQILSPGGQHAALDQVAVNARGDAVAVWEREEGPTLCNGHTCFRVQAAVQPAP